MSTLLGLGLLILAAWVLLAVLVSLTIGPSMRPVEKEPRRPAAHRRTRR